MSSTTEHRFPLTNNLSYMYQLYCSYILLFKNSDDLSSFMDASRLQQGLQQLVRLHYKPVAGWYETRGNHIDVVYSSHEFNDPPFATQTLDISYDTLAAHVNASNEALLVPDAPMGLIASASERLPMFLVKVTYLQDNSGIALGIKYHHSLFDGATLWPFVVNWAHVCRTKQSASIPYPPVFGFPDIEAAQPDDPQFHHSEYELVKPQDCAKEFKTEHEPTKEHRLRLDISAQREFRNAARTASVSFTAMLCAVFWKELSRLRLLLRPEVGSEVSLFTCTVNPRKALGLAPNLCGSPVVNVAVKRTVAEVVALEPADLARLARQAIANAQDPAYMRSSVRFLLNRRLRELDDVSNGRHDEPKLVLSYIPSAAVKCSMSSSRSFPIYDTDFGFGAPVYIRPPYLPFDGCWRIWPTPPADPDNAADPIDNIAPVEIYLTQPAYVDPSMSPLLSRFLLA